MPLTEKGKETLKIVFFPPLWLSAQYFLFVNFSPCSLLALGLWNCWSLLFRALSTMRLPGPTDLPDPRWVCIPWEKMEWSCRYFIQFSHLPTFNTVSSKSKFFRLGFVLLIDYFWLLTVKLFPGSAEVLAICYVFLFFEKIVKWIFLYMFPFMDVWDYILYTTRSENNQL